MVLNCLFLITKRYWIPFRISESTLSVVRSQSNHPPPRAPVTVRSPTSNLLLHCDTNLSLCSTLSSTPELPRSQDPFLLVPTSHPASPDPTSSQAHVPVHHESLVASASHSILREPQRVFQRFALNLSNPLPARCASQGYQSLGCSHVVANATTIDDAADSAAHSFLQLRAYPRAVPNPKTPVA